MKGSRSPSAFRIAPGSAKQVIALGVPFLLALAAALVWPGLPAAIAAGLLAVLLALLLYFLRDPGRIVPCNPDLLLAPADGRVVEVSSVTEPRFLGGEALRVSIFMSVLDVHVNRAPLAGDVILVEHVPGQFLQAFRQQASEVNEHNLIGLETRHGRVLVRQVAGILARRIACWVHPGQRLIAGQRLGIIKLGSRVDLYVQPTAEPVVDVGHRVRAGQSIIARWREEHNEAVVA